LLAAALLSSSAAAEINGMGRVFDPLAYLGRAAAIVAACAIAAAVPAGMTISLDASLPAGSSSHHQNTPTIQATAMPPAAHANQCLTAGEMAMNPL
ncbi:MAG TPA: hypothetical protein PLJ23_12410, partial [Gemmatimonadales bacterium]|nr:hypothetical protein [Gemmatimonadales bacterium]